MAGAAAVLGSAGIQAGTGLIATLLEYYAAKDEQEKEDARQRLLMGIEEERGKKEESRYQTGLMEARQQRKAAETRYGEESAESKRRYEKEWAYKKKMDKSEIDYRNKQDKYTKQLQFMNNIRSGLMANTDGLNRLIAAQNLRSSA